MELLDRATSQFAILRGKIHPKSQPGRAVWHVGYGVLIVSMLFGSKLIDSQLVAQANQIGLVVLAVEVLRPMSYRWLVLGSGARSTNWFVQKYRRFFVTVEGFFLKLGILKQVERALISSMTPFILGLLPALNMGAGLEIVGIAGVILGFADPAAREIGVRWGKLTVFENGKKTFVGASAFLFVGLIVAFVCLRYGLAMQTGLIDAGHQEKFAYAVYLGVLASCLGELATDPIHGFLKKKLERWPELVKIACTILDDNSLVPTCSILTMLVVMAF